MSESHDWQWVELDHPAHRGFHLCSQCGIRVIGEVKGLRVGCF